MMTVNAEEVLVLRQPESEGNFVYRIAAEPTEEVRRWQQRLSEQNAAQMPARHTIPNELTAQFSGPLTLRQVMKQLQARHYRVLDY